MIAPSAIFLPDTDLPAARLDRALRCFREIILHRPALGQLGEAAAEASRTGRVRPAPFSFYPDEAELRAVLAGFGQAASYFRDAVQLDALRIHRADDDMERSGTRIMAGVRGTWRDPEARRDPDREAQLFLYFREKLDRESSEIDGLLADVDRLEAGLGEVMGVERSAEDFEDLGIAPPEPGGSLAGVGDITVRMTPQRLAAWTRVHLAFGPEGVPLVADRPEVVSLLDVNLARLLHTGRELDRRAAEALELVATIQVPTAAAAGVTPDWSAFIARLAGRAWDAAELPALRRQAAETAGGGSPTSGDPETIAVRVWLLPGRDFKASLAAAGGISRQRPTPGLYVGPLFEIAD